MNPISRALAPRQSTLATRVEPLDSVPLSPLHVTLSPHNEHAAAKQTTIREFDRPLEEELHLHLPGADMELSATQSSGSNNPNVDHSLLLLRSQQSTEHPLLMHRDGPTMISDAYRQAGRALHSCVDQSLQFGLLI